MPADRKLGLPACTLADFISYRPETQQQIDLAAAHGITLAACCCCDLHFWTAWTWSAAWDKAAAEKQMRGKMQI